MNSSIVENELDTLQLLRRLGRGKAWILSGLVLGGLLAWGYTRAVTPVWTATAVVDRPQVAQFASYYQQQQLLNNTGSNTYDTKIDTSALADNVYQEFKLQVASIDSRRDFWKQTQYFQRLINQRPTEQAKALEKLVTSISFIPGDTARGIKDKILLQANNAVLSRQWLADYIQFANRRAAAVLTQDLQVERLTAIQQLQQQISIQKAVLETLSPVANTHADNLAAKGQPEVLQNLKLFESLPMLQMQLALLQKQPVNREKFTTWRYFQTPQTPLSQTSPRVLLLCVFWGCIGALVGAVVAVRRCHQYKRSN